MSDNLHIYEMLHHSYILALRNGREADNHATVAHYMQEGADRAYHVRQALIAADRMTAAAAALRDEIARLEADDEEPSEVDQGLIPIPDKYAEA